MSGDGQHHLSDTTLPFPFIVEVQDAESVPVEGVLVTFTVTAGGGRLSNKTVVTDAEGKAETTLTLGQHLGTNTVEASTAWFEKSTIFNALTIPPVTIPDPNLRGCY